MTALADAALWLALLIGAFNVGIGASRWRSPERPVQVIDTGLIAAAALSLVGWGTLAGDLFRGAPLPLLTSAVPIQVDAGTRLGVLWAVGPGAAVSLATACLLAAALTSSLARSLPSQVAMRLAAVLSGTAVALLAAALLSASEGLPRATVPAFAQSRTALVAPLAALAAVALVVYSGALAAAVRGTPAAEAAAGLWRTVVLAAWLLATVALGTEQAARASLGIGPGDPVVPGGASSGLIIWLGAGAMVHRRIRALFLAVPGDGEGDALRRRAGHAAHVGAALIALSFGAHVFAARATIDLPPGVTVSVNDAFGRNWQLVNQGVSRFDATGRDVTALAIQATTPDGRTRLVTTEQRERPGIDGTMVAPVGTRGSTGTALQRLRVLLETADLSDTARVRYAFVPLLILWPVGLVLLTLSAIVLLLTPEVRRGASFSST
ncbi:MAG TPA: hypothetical protein VF981_01105 [Gemmatimonadaceae bacterium]